MSCKTKDIVRILRKNIVMDDSSFDFILDKIVDNEDKEVLALFTEAFLLAKLKYADEYADLMQLRKEKEERRKQTIHSNDVAFTIARNKILKQASTQIDMMQDAFAFVQDNSPTLNEDLVHEQEKWMPVMIEILLSRGILKESWFSELPLT